jgi:LacI family transcriptional regulator
MFSWLREQGYRRALEARWFDAHLVVRTRRDDARVALLQAADAPFVTYGRTGAGERHPWVDTDNEQAFLLATQRQIDFGHRHVALLNGPEVYMFSWLREQGYRRALEAAGLCPQPGHVLHGDPTEKTGYAMARQLLAQPDPPTALLCATDAMAIGAMAACREAGRAVGRDVSVVGYGNTETGAFSDPPLTTIEHRVSDNGRIIGQLLLVRLAGRMPAAWHHLEPVDLVPRGSDGPFTG